MAAPLDPPIYWIPVFFAAIWCSVSFLISRLGWSAFARKYPAATRPPGPSFACPSAWFRSILSSYNNAVRLVFTEAGIYVYPFVLFRLFHDPFLIPWDKASPLTKKERFWGNQTQLDVRDGPLELHLTLTAKAVRELERLRPV